MYDAHILMEISQGTGKLEGVLLCQSCGYPMAIGLDQVVEGSALNEFCESKGCKRGIIDSNERQYMGV